MNEGERWRSGPSDLWALALFLLIVLWLARGIIAGAQDPFTVSLENFEPWKSQLPAGEVARPQIPIDEAVTQFYPRAVFAHGCLQNGQLPLWNPHIMSGTPFVADRLTGLFNPLLLLAVWLLPPTAALTFIYSIHHLLGGWFMYLFLKCLGIRRPAALFGGIAYMLQGAYLPWLGFEVSDNAYFPMTFYYLERAFNRQDRPGILGFIVSFALLAVTGYPQKVVFQLYLTSAWVLFTRGPGFAPAVRRLLGLFLMLLLAFLLGAMQHLPMIEFFRLSLRADPEFQATFHSLVEAEKYDSPLTLLAIFFPRLWGDYISDAFLGLPRDVVALRNYAYIGILAAFGALFAPLVRRNRHAVFFTAWFLLGWLFISFNGFYLTAVRFLPGLRFSQGKPYFLATTSMIIVATFVLNYLLARLPSDKTTGKRLSQTCILILALWGGLLILLLEALFIPKFLPGAYTASLAWIVCGVGILAFCLILLSLYARGRALKWAVAGIIILEIIDLLPYHEHFNPLVQKGRAVFVTPSIEFLQDRMVSEGPFRLFRDRALVLRPNTPMLFGLDDMSGFDSFVSANYGNFFRTVDPTMITDSRFIGIPHTIAAYQEPFWSFLGVRYLISPGPMPDLPPPWREAWSGEIYIYENPDWLPRWFLVSRIIPVKTIEEGFKVAQEIEPSIEAVVEGIDPADIPSGMAESDDSTMQLGGENPRVAGTVTVQHYAPDEAVLDLSADRDALLVFSDTYFPGWRAWLDGKEVRIYRTDGVIKGILIPSGSHVVRFLYDPVSMKIGWLLFAAGLVLIPLSIGMIKRMFNG